MQYGSRSWLGSGRVVKAANEVRFTLNRGETVGIVGESGSGKSTVARCIARLLRPTAGQLQLGETEIASLDERHLRQHRRKIQIVFQDPYRSLNPRRTIQDSIIEGPVNFGMAKEEAIGKATELMSLVRLPVEALARYPHQFSGGQRQRIAIARALAMQHEVLIDEAVSALDVSVQKQVLEVLEDAQKRFDLAILFITHDLRVAAQICDHVLVMKNGTVVEAGRTFDVFNSPRDAYTQKLLQASPGHKFELASAQAL